ncbi:MAG: phosphatidylserine decarboxylase family protein [Blastocatellia bacterium]
MLKDAWLFIVPVLIVAALVFSSGWTYAWIPALLLLGLAGFIAFFFRDPVRQTPAGDDLVVSPADGKVMFVRPVDSGAGEPQNQVSIFLSVFDVHVNRTPIGGEIKKVAYQRGKFRNAMANESSVENEQNVVTVENERIRVVFSQIAGLIARRIVFWFRAGDHVEKGQKVGLIRFGSRTDLFLPVKVEILVRAGDRVRGGVTVIGKIIS